MSSRKLYPDQEPISRADLRLLVIYAFRYALGRRTSAPSFVAGVMRGHAHLLSEEDRRQMSEDIAWHERTFGLGAECDAETWNALRKWLEGG